MYDIINYSIKLFATNYIINKIILDEKNYQNICYDSQSYFFYLN